MARVRLVVVHVGASDRVGWVASVPTTDGVRTTGLLAWSAFSPVGRFLEPLAVTEPLDPSTISVVRLYLVEKAPGPFRLSLHALG